MPFSRFFSRFFPSKAPLTGAPERPRIKTYSALSGYVYQYRFQGRRAASLERAAATEYVFSVSADRRTSFPVSVMVPDEAVRQWEQRHEREINGPERYAIAKMSLFEAFDERPDPAALREAVVVRATGVDEILKSLERE
jgi:hypothetical protein